MLYLYGESAYSDFRLAQKKQTLQTENPQVIDIKANYIYCGPLLASLSDAAQAKAAVLLTASAEKPAWFTHASADPNTALLFVVPRLGTISPWSSKATDILHHCDLTDIERIERGIAYQVQYDTTHPLNTAALYAALHDPLLESVLTNLEDCVTLFAHPKPSPLKTVDVLKGGVPALKAANQREGFALNEDEMDYLVSSFKMLGRDPHDVELMMFAQINSEHCRHKIFKADWTINGEPQTDSLFGMIQATYRAHSEGVLSAYADNAAVIQGAHGHRFYSNPHTHVYTAQLEPIHIVLKVETHNHPTAISPFPGAATGSGGEIRDEGATGRGGKPKAGLTGFTVSHLHLDGFEQPWELPAAHAAHMATPKEIMLEGPIGGAAFNNEFGRPNICGYFRTFEMLSPLETRFQNTQRLGYHKPIMIAGGIGNIREDHVQKCDLPPGTQIIVLGGPAMRIGLGGGAASSMAAGMSSTDLDFASVQRGNPEMQRRCQEVIDTCWALGEDNPILSIHDVGAGGLCNAVPEIVHDNARGGRFELRAVPNSETGMSPLEIWCNEAQERYVLAILESELEYFSTIAQRECCPFAVIGEVTEAQTLVLGDGHFDNLPIDMPMEVLFGNAPKMLREATHYTFERTDFETAHVDLNDAAKRVLQFPAVADKSFLIHIGDRTVGGLVMRDQLVGPWQVPVSNVAVTAASFQCEFGEAMAMGERTPLAVLHPKAASRMAIGEAITNIVSAKIDRLDQVKLSANWMAAANHTGQDAALFDAVHAASELCVSLGLTIPVGKDSMSMRATWKNDEQETMQVASPVSLIVTAAAHVTDVEKTLTPELRQSPETALCLIDLGKGHQRLGGSVLAQTYQQLGHHTPDCDDPNMLRVVFDFIQTLNADRKILACHDRSDGGLFATVSEMMFASHVGLTVTTDSLGDDPIRALFNEELGVVIQVPLDDYAEIEALAHAQGFGHHFHTIARLNNTDTLTITHAGKTVYEESRTQLHAWWSETSYRMQALRDNPECAAQAYAQIQDTTDPGLHATLTYDPEQLVSAPYIATGHAPQIAILREQGVNGQVEMAAAFTQAGFKCKDVHMSDFVAGRVNLGDYVGMAVCGGFSYGDVLGAGQGWANSILYHDHTRRIFQDFFERKDTFTLGVCNGCQMLAHLKEIVPGSDHWPKFVRNTSEQFEARLALVKVQDSPSILFDGMQGSVMPIAVAHGEGHAAFSNTPDLVQLKKHKRVTLALVDNHGEATTRYPMNPNGSPEGITGLCSEDGRINLMMPHPERVFQSRQFSWHPNTWGTHSPWLRLFENARVWVG